jgi:hypothetical protein
MRNPIAAANVRDMMDGDCYFWERPEEIDTDAIKSPCMFSAHLRLLKFASKMPQEQNVHRAVPKMEEALQSK